MIRKTALLLLIACCMAVLAGCNTMEGFGKDVKQLGEKIEDASDGN